jgi:hypothetical protein
MEGCPKVSADVELGLDAYELDIHDFLKPIKPPPGFDLEPLDPKQYFITSGDAIQKTTYLNKIIWNYAGHARKRLHQLPNPTKKDIEFEKFCWEQAGAVKKLLNVLIRIKGGNVFFETEWVDGTIHCVLKNPRPKKDDKADD